MQRGVVIEPGEDNGGGGGGDDRDEGREHFERRFEIVLAVLLGLAAIATAFAAYMTELRDGDALKNFQEGNRIADQASQRLNNAAASRNEDQIVTTFAIQAALDNPEAADEVGNVLVEEIGSPELQAAFDGCDADPDCDVPPIDSEYYELPEAAEAERLDAQADAKFAAADANDEKGDNYSLVTVLLATSLFLYGVAAVSRARNVKLGTAGAGFVIFAASVVGLVLA
jgi:hypothetical protein